MADPQHSKSLLGRIVRWTLLGVTVAVLGVIIWTVAVAIRGPQIVEHVSPQQAPISVPSDATDICYNTRPVTWPNLFVEFSVSEASFKAWAKSHDDLPTEIESQPLHFPRYTFYQDGGPREVVISNGLTLKRMFEPDAGVHIAYDRQTGRAYFWFQTR